MSSPEFSRYIPESEQKPPIVFHGSRNKHIEVFEPRAERVRDREEGPVVFALAKKELATAFLADTDDSWTRHGIFNGVPVTIISDQERFRREDQGGALYALPSDTFTLDTTRGRREWTSREPVTPLGKEEYASCLTAMLDAGIQVYFVDQPTFQRIADSPDHGLSILRTLESENQKEGKNPREIPVEAEGPNP